MDRQDTEKDFITAFWKLYADRPKEKISVSMLCDTAGYNRSTFYNHFEDIHDLFEKAVDGIFEPVRTSIMSKSNLYDILQGDLVRPILSSTFIQKNTYIELAVPTTGLPSSLKEKIKQELLTFFQDQPDIITDIGPVSILLEYQLSAVMGVIDFWYRSGTHISQEEMLENIYEISVERGTDFSEGSIKEERLMKKNRLGNTDIFVSPVSFGVLTVGNTQLNLPVEEGAALIKYAVSKGINFFDTAQYYRTLSLSQRSTKRCGHVEGRAGEACHMHEIPGSLL